MWKFFLKIFSESPNARELYEQAIEKKTRESAKLFFEDKAPSTQACVEIWEMALRDKKYILAGEAIAQAGESANGYADVALVKNTVRRLRRMTL